MEQSLSITFRIRKQDELLMEHFSRIVKGDQSFEIRRLLNLAIKIEQNQLKSNNR